MSAQDPGDVDVDAIAREFDDSGGDDGLGFGGTGIPGAPGGGVDFGRGGGGGGGGGGGEGPGPGGTGIPGAPGGGVDFGGGGGGGGGDGGPAPGDVGIPGAPGGGVGFGDDGSGGGSGGDAPPSDPTPEPDPAPAPEPGLGDRDPVDRQPAPAEDPQDIINLTSTDPRFREDLFRDPAQQISFTEQFEQRLRRRFDDPSIVLGPGEIAFEETEEGRFLGSVGSEPLLRSQAVRQQARRDFQEQFERSTGREVEPGDIELEPAEGGIRGGLSAEAIRRFQQDQLDLARDLLDADGAVSSISRGETGVIEGPDLASTISVDERGGQPSLVLTRGDQSGARRRIREQFESELGVDVSESDIEFQEEDGQLVGRLTPEAQEEIQVQQEPLVQVTQDTPLEQPFETGRRIGVRQAAQRTRRRERLFGAIGQRERAEQAVQDIGLGDELEGFRSLQQDARAELANLRQSAIKAGERGLALAAAPVALPLGFALRQTGTPPDALEEIPSPAEEPASFAVAAAPLAAAEPTPFGEVAVVGGALIGGAALASQRQQRRATTADLEAAAQADLEFTLEATSGSAMADPPGLFVPEQEQPTEPIGRGFFQPDFPIGPSRQELPELLPPTDPQSDIQTGRLTRPELEVPEEPAVDPFPAEVPTPQEPTGVGLFPSEQEVPTAEAAALIGEMRETRERIDRERRRRRRRVPEEMIPDGPTTIGGTEAGEGDVSTGGGATGPTFIVRPDPRSMELRRIETEEGEFEVGPELTRFLEAAELEQILEPELEPTEEGATLPPAQDIGAELAALEAAGELTAQREAAVLSPLEDTLLGVDTAERLDERTGIGVAPQQAQANVQATNTASRTRTLPRLQQVTGTAEVGLGATFEAVFEEMNVPRFGEEFPTETVTTTTTIEGFDLNLPPTELPEDRRRDEDFERRFEFDVLEPLEALGATPGLDAGEPDET